MSAISVVIPARNRAEHVVLAVRSALEQRDVDVEVVVVDDASEDGTPEALAQFGDRIRVLRNDTRQERGASRNRGARTATHDRIAFLDSDDEYAPGALAAHAAGRDVTIAGWRHMSENGVLDQHVNLPDARAHRALSMENRLGGAATLAVDRHWFERVGGFPEDFEVQGSEDWVFLYRLKCIGAPMHFLPQPLLHVRLHGGNSTGDPHQLARSMWAAAREIGDPIGTARTAGVIARNMARQRHWGVARTWLRRSWAVPSEGARATMRCALSAGRSFVPQ